MEFPDVAAGSLQDRFLRQYRPCCLRLDDDFSLLERWGYTDWCGVSDLPAGTDLREALPFLVGLPLDEALEMDFVGGADGRVFHVRILPDDPGGYVVLLDAGAEHEMLRKRQQATNELRLMHTRQNKLIARQRDLISELVETRSELDHHRQEAERSSANKSRFIAMMSHEFRTPLASILNYAALAQEPASTDDDVRKSIETIVRSARHLDSLVDALLDDASLTAGRIELEPETFDCYALLNDLAGMMAPLAADKDLSYATLIDTDVPRWLHADAVRLRQVLINLVGNAVKFTVEGGVRILAAYTNDRFVITVSDTGPGIGTEDQERVFRAFERGSQRAGEGAGLGLTITLRLVELMGGEVSLDSTPGEGCTVSVHVPAPSREGPDDEAEEVLPAPESDTMADQQVSVLVCDDDEDMLALVEHYLHRSGYGLIATSDSSDAIAKTAKYDPDLVLMDCNLPGLGGVAAAKVLRQRGFDRPILALTASTLTQSEAMVFTEVFRKPAAMHELLTSIKRLTHRQDTIVNNPESTA